ncbi:hypothetical protein TNIN_121861 [Trichonephila inaurata madagascariensis]|uniref:Uncharacterized protein n=1 Tax=Trichonephila inaurata madagascariensis TaxID=2747483 RepID=A0A8X6WPH9_9ARAC|nr:hypothetical protein TNIN_121861 [Trichonephila inaurata madagascariensis]
MQREKIFLGEYTLLPSVFEVRGREREEKKQFSIAWGREELFRSIGQAKRGRGEADDMQKDGRRTAMVTPGLTFVPPPLGRKSISNEKITHPSWN